MALDSLMADIILDGQRRGRPPKKQPATWQQKLRASLPSYSTFLSWFILFLAATAAFTALGLAYRHRHQICDAVKTATYAPLCSSMSALSAALLQVSNNQGAVVATCLASQSLAVHTGPCELQRTPVHRYAVCAGTQLTKGCVTPGTPSSMSAQGFPTPCSTSCTGFGWVQAERHPVHIYMLLHAHIPGMQACLQ